ncbi:formylglycine-generating enzyme family protein [Methylolobus aquaticus]
MAASLSLASNFPAPFPAAWASAWGEDEYGLWMTLEYGGAEQTFRWIEPGTFLMGSPEDEPERSDDEVQHEVTLTRGYWLADTACTQAFWVAVMGKNPSQFQSDPENPVDTVSWDAAQTFIAQLNGVVDGLNARLPTEAEWEYACRAGTATPFWFGHTVTPEWVNYHGELPYPGALMGLHRKTTVPVKALPANDWGLYQMHGNVFEWCADIFGPYPSGPERDPIGLSEGPDRVLRGGSFFSGADAARSAYRLRAHVSYLLDGFGVRLALGPWHPPGR